jgi:eukaryotic-like serine/threonine-protein kinase
MFTHTLIRETLYSSLSLIRRVRTHRRLGEALEQLYARDLQSHLGELAYHFLRAAEGGDLSKALDYVIGAAEEAQAKLAYEEAAELVGQGLELLQGDVTDADIVARQAELLLILGDAQRRAGETSAARATFRSAFDAARPFGQPDVLGRAALGVGLGSGGLVRASRADHEIIELLEQALTAVGEQPSALRVRITARLAEELYFTKSPRSGELGNDAVAMAELVGDDAVRLAALYAREFSRVGPDTPPRDQLEATAEILKLAYQLGDGELAYQAHLLREMIALEAEDLATAESELAGAERLIDDLKIASLRAWVTAARSRRAWLAGEFAEADRLNAEALNEGADPDIAMLVIGGQTMAQQILRGDLNDYVPLLKEFSALYPEHAIIHCFSAYACAIVGRLADAREEFDRFAVSGFDLPRDETWLDAIWALGRCCAILGDVARAEEMYEITLPSEDRWLADRAFISLGPVATLLGILAATAGRPEVAGAHFERAMAQAIAFPSPPWLADAQAEYAFVLLQSELRAEYVQGAALAAAALATAQQLGMTSLEERVSAVYPG